jgi:translation initiation factor IF-2
LNKIDKPEADPDRVLSQLAELNVTTDAWGGSTPLVKISAKTGQGIDDLLETILLVAEMNADKIRANPDRLAVGTIIESHVDKGEGPVATVLVQSGTLHRNEHLGIAGAAYGRVRSMRDWTGKQLDAATPGTPVKILGFRVAPAVGDILEIPEDPKSLEVKKVKTAQQVASQLTATKSMPAEGESVKSKKVLNVVLKCDTLGSLEALLGMFEKIQHEDVGVEVIQKGLGNVTEGDVTRALNSPPSVVYAFNVVVTPQAALLARDKNVEVKDFKIIYDLFDDVITHLNILVPPEVIVTPLGWFETVAIFRTESGRMVVGGKVTEGKVLSGENVRVWRGEDPIGVGVVDSLQTGKQTAKEAHAGQECGISFKGKVKLQPGDRLEIYHEETKERKIVLQR